MSRARSISPSKPVSIIFARIEYAYFCAGLLSIYMLKPSFTTLLRHPAYLLAFGGGAGLAPKAPGTVGSLVALPIYLLLLPLAPLSSGVLVGALFLLGVWACARTERDLGVHDPPGIVWGAIVGLAGTLL